VGLIGIYLQYLILSQKKQTRELKNPVLSLYSLEKKNKRHHVKANTEKKKKERKSLPVYLSIYQLINNTSTSRLLFPNFLN